MAAGVVARAFLVFLNVWSGSCTNRHCHIRDAIMMMAGKGVSSVGNVASSATGAVTGAVSGGDVVCLPT